MSRGNDAGHEHFDDISVEEQYVAPEEDNKPTPGAEKAEIVDSVTIELIRGDGSDS